MPTTNNVEPTTSATERLRALLDERGVEWRDQSDKWEWQTSWSSPAFGLCIASHMNRKDADMELSLPFLTPEQAVAATLGPGTCHAVFEVDAMSGDERIGEFVCSECGETFGDGRYQRPRYCPNCGRKLVK